MTINFRQWEPFAAPSEPCAAVIDPPPLSHQFSLPLGGESDFWAFADLFPTIPVLLAKPSQSDVSRYWSFPNQSPDSLQSVSNPSPTSFRNLSPLDHHHSWRSPTGLPPSPQRVSWQQFAKRFRTRFRFSQSRRSALAAATSNPDS